MNGEETTIITTTRLTNVLSALYKIAVVLVILFVVGMVSLIVSLSFFVWFRQRMISPSIIKEQVHFDYTSSPAIARINLLQVSRQWDCINCDCTNYFQSCANIGTPNSYLREGEDYDVTLSLTIARTDEIMGDVLMMRTTMSDAFGKPIAISSRPFIITYKSPVTRFLDGLVLYPVRILQYLTNTIWLKSAQESEKITKTVIPDYRENGRPTHTIEIELIGKFNVVQESWISIEPRHRGIS